MGIIATGLFENSKDTILKNNTLQIGKHSARVTYL